MIRSHHGRTHLPALLAGVLLLLLTAAPVSGLAVAGQPLPGVSVTSDNVTHVGYLADVGPTVSARMVQVDDQKRLYVSSIGRGLSIYDVTSPAEPSLIGALPLAGWQNEDIAVSDDGDVAVLAYGDANFYTFNLVIDTSDPTLPRLASQTAGGDHTAECVTPDCSYLYGSEGNIYDLSDIDNPVTLSTGWRSRAQQQGVNISGFPHKVIRDAAGYVVTDSSPRVMFAVDPAQHPDASPANPIVVSRHRNPPPSSSIQYQHNNLRPRADEWEPRDQADPGDVADGALRAGELLLANGETNIVPQCNGQGGPFMTWSMRDWDLYRDTSGAEGQFELIETFRPLGNGNYLDGDPAVNALGCSGHWFDWTTHTDNETYTVAAAWFEHGARFLEVDAATGAIEEVGFFQPINGSAGATYWIDEEYVYVTDYVRGIDILRFDPDPDNRPAQDELDANWIAGLDRPKLAVTQRLEAICRLGGPGR